MSDQLPISIIPSEELAQTFERLTATCNKLEAQFNFHTMAAGWYGDEEDILMLRFLLETPADFSVYKDQNSNARATVIQVLSDDVICYQANDSLQLDCVVALTETEQQLLLAKSSVTFTYLEIKLHKILNLIAKDKGLVKV
ncbi:MAG: hypothetical protein ACPG46_11590 [Thalassotalea sp.]